MMSLILPNFLTSDQVAALRAQAAVLLDAFDPTSHPITKFTTDPDAHTADDYFLTSGDKIHYFLETDAVNAQGNLCMPKERAVNKIGHALHALDPVFRDITFRDSIRNIACALGYKDPQVLQSMIIFKQPKIGGDVAPHQDSTFLYTEPLSAVGFWFALEDCTAENGALAFVPGSHKTTPVTRRFVRAPQGGAVFTDSDATLKRVPDDAYVLQPCPAGSLVLIHGSVLHKSSKNTSERSRWAYTFHVIEGRAAYAKDNWLQPASEEGFTPL